MGEVGACRHGFDFQVEVSECTLKTWEVEFLPTGTFARECWFCRIKPICGIQSLSNLHSQAPSAANFTSSLPQYSLSSSFSEGLCYFWKISKKIRICSAEPGLLLTSFLADHRMLWRSILSSIPGHPTPLLLLGSAHSNFPALYV